jgi:hypothetical protein
MKDLTGQVFTRLTVLEVSGKNNNGHYSWLCQCECGIRKVVPGGKLIRGKTKSCGCYKKDMARFHKRIRPFEAQYNSFIATAKHTKHGCTVTYEEFVEFTSVTKCHYCAAGIPWKPYISGKTNAYYLDRKDNVIGYTKENCVVCCTRCNYGKSFSFSYDEWVAIGKTIKRLRKKSQCQ